MMKKYMILFITSMLLFVYVAVPVGAQELICTDTALEVAESYLYNAAIARFNLGEFTPGLYSISTDEQKWLTNSENLVDPMDFESISFNTQRIAYYKGLIELSGSQFDYVEPTYRVLRMTGDNGFVQIEIEETINFKYSELDDISMVATQYSMKLIQIEDTWKVAGIIGTDIFYTEYWGTEFNLDYTLDGIRRANIECESSNCDTSFGELTFIPSRSTSDRVYNGANAANYALTYSTLSDNTNSNPSAGYINTYYLDVSQKCQWFVSQCVRAGFAGSDTAADVNTKQAMDDTGNYKWWCTKTACNNSDYSYNSWISCSRFRTYLLNVHNNPSESGIYANYDTVDYNSSNLKYSSGELLGAVLHVKGDGSYGHAVIITNALGNTRQTVYFTAYNKCYRNYKLSDCFPASTYDDECGVYVIIPQYYRAAPTDPSNYITADTVSPTVHGSSKTVTAYCQSLVSSMSILVYDGSDTLMYNTSYFAGDSVTGTYTFTTAGLWKVVITATGLPSLTFRVRVL